MQKRTTTRNSKTIKAAREALYQAFTSPEALAQWLAPGEMTGRVHRFDLRVGGGYEMSLFYPPSASSEAGKTSGNEDRFTARFTALDPPARIVQVINFASDDPAFRGDMRMTTTFQCRPNGTRVTIQFDDIPPGIRPEDNKAGTRLTLQKLARFLS